MLQVVEYQQQFAVPELRYQLLAGVRLAIQTHVQDVRDRVDHVLRRGDRSERRKEDTVFEGPLLRPRHFDGQSGLADPARPDQGNQSAVGPLELGRERLLLRVAPHELGWLSR